MAFPDRDLANPYAAPASQFTPEFTPSGIPGGTLEQTLAGQTRWTIEEILRDSWARVGGFKGTFWLASLAIMGASLASGLIGAAVLRFVDPGIAPVVQFIINTLLSVVVFWPLQAGFFMLGVRRAAGVETRASQIGEFFPQAGRIAGLLILQSILMMLGFLLLIIPGIYLAISYVLAVPLLVDRRLGIWESLETSRRAIGTCWFRTFCLMLVLGLLGLLGALTLGIGMIWLAPLFIISIGMLYHRLIGYAGEAER